MQRFLFPVSLFLSAVLLFSIQPMVAKTLLPVYGGTPAVWTVCMLFFQAVLLVSYGYVWMVSYFNRPAVWRAIHTVLLVLSVMALPFMFHPIPRDGLPEWGILYNLLTQMGLPLLIIGASAPLLQFAYSQTRGKGAADPYFLYVASNLGSLLALLVYPWLIERFTGLVLQFHLWSIGYGVYLVLLFFILHVIPYKPLPQQAKEVEMWPWKDMGRWVFLAFIPCSLMMGVTLYITTDVAATPLFWVMPLALYLLSFILTFTSKSLIPHDWLIRNSIFFLIFTIIGFILRANQVFAWELILVNLVSFFVLALLCHKELFQRRPNPQGLTLFYFCLAFGGVLAGIFNGILAPHLFNQIYEYPLAILCSLLVLPIPKKTRGIVVFIAVFGVLLIPQLFPHLPELESFAPAQIAALLALIFIVVWQQNKALFIASMSLLFVFIFVPSLQSNDIFLVQNRSFYAVNRVIEKEGIHAFISQSTVHGLQILSEKKPSDGFNSYYGALKPLIEGLKSEFKSMAVTIIGLGTGTMVCQFRENDNVKVVEIDQQVIDIAKNTQLFTYLRDCHSEKIIKNDGRLAIEKLPDGSQNLLVLDAFNSDAIPVHLMTLEAFSLYKRKISDDGVILINLSNRHLELLPVVNAMGRSLELMTFSISHKGDRKIGQFDSQWALLTSNQHLVSNMREDSGWRFVTSDKQLLWTDDYSNIIPLLKWR